MKSLVKANIVILLVLGSVGVPQLVYAVEDTTPPVPVCSAIGNFHSGFFTLSATDNVSAPGDIQLFIKDNGTGTIFGPFANGEGIKYTQSTKTPSMMAHGDLFFIFGTGDPSLIAIDLAGNTGEVSCLP